MNAAILLDYAGVTLFAATGALVASRKELDIIGFLFLATVTGIGGGTFRDLVLGVPVFWVVQPLYILFCAGAAVLTFFTAHLLESRYRWVLWLDAAALAAYCVMGAWKGLAVTGSATLAIVMGMLTAAAGGVVRDVLAGEPSVLLRREIYMLAAMAGAAAFVAVDAVGARLAVSAAAGFAVAFGVRSGALVFGWSVPSYRSRPGRDPEVSLGRAPGEDRPGE